MVDKIENALPNAKSILNDTGVDLIHQILFEDSETHEDTSEWRDDIMKREDEAKARYKGYGK